MNLRILSDEGHIMSSYSTAKAYIENSQRYNQEDLTNVDMLAKENAKGSTQKKITGLFGNFSQTSDPPPTPPFWEPLVQNENFWVIL